MEAIGPEQAALYGLSINENNGIYNNGYEFDVDKKLSVEVNLDGRTNSSQVSKRTGVGRGGLFGSSQACVRIQCRRKRLALSHLTSRTQRFLLEQEQVEQTC
jgi:hypothetical protein